MRVDDIIQSEDSREELEIIAEQCSEFLKESKCCPLLKNLPSEYGDFHKVKVRKRKHRKQDPKGFSEMFNGAFANEVHSLRERAIFAHGEESLPISEDAEQEPFYIFPIDGYSFMYSREVENSSVNYKSAFDSILEQLGTDEGKNIISELLRFSYTSDNLAEGIDSGSEIIIYDVPYFYAIRKRTVEDYETMMNTIKESI